jgi:UDP-2,4-diacetamido-2,4,6-trideoxy-beta-L-altropyranose hydrolase
MRCLTLGDALRARGVRCYFISRDRPGHMIATIREHGFEVMVLPVGGTPFRPASPAEVPLPAHSGWLACGWQEDAEQTLRVVQAIEPDLLVIDHYAIDVRWEEVIRPYVHRIMVIDDLADRKHHCDVLLDQNLYADMQTRYSDEVPAHCQLLLGPRYALLRDEFRELRKQVKLRTGEVKRILVFLGGVDADNYTGLAIEALAGAGIGDAAVDVVIGAQHPRREAIEAACVVLGYVCHVETRRMGELMAAADLSIGAGGSASWERCCLGLPALLVALAENQVAIAQELDLAGACIYLGTKERVDANVIRNAISDLLAEQDWVAKLSKGSLSLVDGMGVDVVCQKLIE